MGLQPAVFTPALSFLFINTYSSQEFLVYASESDGFINPFYLRLIGKGVIYANTCPSSQVTCFLQTGAISGVILMVEFEAVWPTKENCILRVWCLWVSFKSSPTLSLNFCSTFPPKNEETGFGTTDWTPRENSLLLCPS